MKCTQCSNQLRPVVAIDIDGTLGDYHNHLYNFASGYFGRQTSELAWQLNAYDGSVTHSEWFEKFGIPLHEFRAMKLAFRQGGMKRNMPIYNGARELTVRCREAGAEVWLCTTRPYLRLDSVDPDTRFWLDLHRIEFDHLIFGDEKYTDLAKYVDPARVVFVLDDEFYQYIIAQKRFGSRSAFLRRVHFNRSRTESARSSAGDLEEAWQLADVRIRDWGSD